MTTRVPWMVRVGQELQQEGLEDCSFVTTTYCLPDRLVGSIGVVGPRRMAYGQVISQISFVRQTIDHLLGLDGPAEPLRLGPPRPRK